MYTYKVKYLILNSASHFRQTVHSPQFTTHGANAWKMERKCGKAHKKYKISTIYKKNIIYIRATFLVVLVVVGCWLVISNPVFFFFIRGWMRLSEDYITSTMKSFSFV